MLGFSQLLQKTFKHLLCPSSTIHHAIKPTWLSSHKKIFQIRPIFFFSAHDTKSVVPLPPNLGPFNGEIDLRHKSGNQTKGFCCCGLTFSKVRAGVKVFFKVAVHTDFTNL